MKLLLLVAGLSAGLVQATHEMQLQRTELDVKIPKAISDHTANVGSDNLIYIAGGCDSPDGNVFVDEGNSSFFYCATISSSLWAFDPGSNEFIEMPDLPRPRYRHAAVSIQDHIFFVGGRDAEDNLIREVDVFDTATRDWATETLPEGYATSDLAGWGAENRAYFAGGYDATYTAQDIVFSIDVAKYKETGEPELEDHAPLLFPRGDTAATVNLDEGYAYVSGGFSHINDFCEPLDSVERYSLPGDAWINVAKLPTARADKAMVTYQGHTLSIGGERQVENKCELDKPLPGELTVAVDDIEVLNDDDSTWQQLDPLPEHRFRFAAVVFEGTIYTFGGQQEFDESCGCLKTVDEVVSYIDVAPIGPEEADAEDDHSHDHEDGEDHDEEAGTGASTDAAEDITTADDGESGAMSAKASILVSLLLVLFVSGV